MPQAATTVQPPEVPAHEFRAIMFTDVAGSLRMAHRLGEDAAWRAVAHHYRVVRGLIPEFGGQEVKSLGDGMLITFDSVVPALDAAVAIQRRTAHENAGEDPPVSVRIGIACGPVIVEGGDIFGVEVYLANRVAEYADGGEINVTEAVRDLAGEVPYTLEDLGPIALLGMREMKRLFNVRWP